MTHAPLTASELEALLQMANGIIAGNASEITSLQDEVADWKAKHRLSIATIASRDAEIAALRVEVAMLLDGIKEFQAASTPFDLEIADEALEKIVASLASRDRAPAAGSTRWKRVEAGESTEDATGEYPGSSAPNKQAAYIPDRSKSTPPQPPDDHVEGIKT